MIDVIISAYNAHETITKTLLSIEMQTMVNDIKIYIVDDASNRDYEYLKDMFKDLKITIIRNEKNCGPGLSRQKALDNSNSKYIVFIDADDVFYDPYAIESLYKNLDGYDTSWGIVVEQESEEDFIFERGKDTYLHGKMYRRELIDKNDIKFCDSRNHEDNAFNMLYKSCCKEIHIFEQPVYVYTKNENSITNNTSESERIKSFVKVYTWLLKEEIKRKTDEQYIAIHVYSVVLYLYFNYYLYREYEDFGFIFYDMKEIKRIFEKYDMLDENTKISIYNNFNLGVIPDESVNDFLNRIK